MLTSKQILDLIAAKPGPMARGAAMAAASRNRRDQVFTANQRQFLEEFAQQVPPAMAPVTHPESVTTAMPRQPSEGTAGLEPADIAWMQRLPTDPAQVSFDDAVQLASLARVIPPRTSDRRLLDAVWQPVKDLHDLRVAEGDLAAARTPLPSVPSPALNALAEALGRETPQLAPDEALTRASRLLKDALDKRTADRDARIEVAARRLDELNAERTRRAAVTV